MTKPPRHLRVLRALRGRQPSLRTLRGWSVLPLLLLLPICGCAGYQIGNQALYPCEVRTVYVPMIESNSFRRDLGERLTEAVVKEIELRTPYKVVNSSRADSILTARLISEGKKVLVPTLTGNAREVQVHMLVEVSWVDRKGSELRQKGAIPLPSEITDVTGTGNLVPEVGQSVATAQQEAISRVAQQIVGLMERPW